MILPVAAALGLAAWSATTLLPGTGDPTLDALPVLLSTLSPLVSLLAVAVIALSLRHRNWVAAVIALLAGAFPWWFLAGYAVPNPVSADRPATVRILVVSARDGRADARQVASVALAERADVLVVTELSGTLAHDIALDGVAGLLPSRFVEVPTGDATGGLGIWSRYPISDLATVAGTTWPAVTGVLDTGTARLHLVAGHVPAPLPSPRGWSRDLAALHRAAEVPGPVALLGNLNADPWQPQFRSVASGRLRDAADVLGQGLRPTWPSWSLLPVLPLDHVLVGGGIGVSALSSVPISGTDHRALLATVQVPRSS